MKILAIMSSGRKNGNTGQIVEMLGSQLQEVANRYTEPVEFTTLNLYEANLHPCRGCRVCFDKGEQFCPFKDDLLAIKSKMHEADCVIFASPVYVGDVNGVMKNLIGRLAHVCHRPEFGGKYCFLLTTVGSSPPILAHFSLGMAVSTWGFHSIGKMGFKTGDNARRDFLEERYQKEVTKVAIAISNAIRKGTFTKPSFSSLMTFKIQQSAWSKANEESVDYRYWRDQGWLNPNSKYFVAQKANRVIIMFARMIGSIFVSLMN